MFCFQCQETNKNSGCEIGGVCGKKATTAVLQDELIQALKAISLSHNQDENIGLFVVQSLFMTITNANFDDDKIKKQIEKAKILASDVDVTQIQLGVKSCEDEDIRSLRELLTYGLKGVAAYLDHAAVLGYEDKEIYAFILEGLRATLNEEFGVHELVGMVLKCGQMAVKTMALLDHANTSTFGNPELTKVKIDVGNRPGILVSGHDLLDLKELLEQSKDAGIDIYTHSEMLVANSYPELKKYPHLYGNYGNAWHRQNIEFVSFNGPILMTTNCITPVQESYKKRIFTTGMAGYPGVKHIENRVQGRMKDFSEIISFAQKSKAPTKLESGFIINGFGHHQVLALADKVVEAVKSGKIKEFVVMAGCDGRQVIRNYYTEKAKNLPKDHVILTAGCAKYRYNKLALGDIDGIPRILDAGQCNDSYSLAVIAMKLQEVFGLDDINKLPITFDIAWYEQKAVAVLLALLALGFKNIKIGPTAPAFVSPNVFKVLVDNFNLKV